MLLFTLNDDWALITRTKFPVISQPPKKTGDSWETGFSNGYHWLSEPGQQWTVPVGGGFAKMLHIAGQHIQLAIDSYYNVARPQALTFVFTK